MARNCQQGQSIGAHFMIGIDHRKGANVILAVQPMTIETDLATTLGSGRGLA